MMAEEIKSKWITIKMPVTKRQWGTLNPIFTPFDIKSHIEKYKKKIKLMFL
jgi:hypothetical protein